MTDNLIETLLTITEPYYAQLEKQGALRDNEVVTDRVLAGMQRPVLHDANAAVVLFLKAERYRRRWAYKDKKRQDKWAHRDKVRAMKQARKATLKAMKASADAAERNAPTAEPQKKTPERPQATAKAPKRQPPATPIVESAEGHAATDGKQLRAMSDKDAKANNSNMQR